MSIIEKELLVEHLHNAYLNELVLTRGNPFKHMTDEFLHQHYMNYIVRYGTILPQTEKTVEYMEWFVDMVMSRK